MKLEAPVKAEEVLTTPVSKHKESEGEGDKMDVDDPPLKKEVHVQSSTCTSSSDSSSSDSEGDTSSSSDSDEPRQEDIAPETKQVRFISPKMWLLNSFFKLVILFKGHGKYAS